MKQTILCLSLMIGSSLAASAANLAPNPGFEIPANAPEGTAAQDWLLFSSKQTLSFVAREVKRTGEQSLKVSAQKLPGSYQGVYLSLPVTEGEKYTFSIYAINNKVDPVGGTAHGQLALEWIDATGKEISRDYSQIWNSSLSKMRWETIAIRKKQAPKGAVNAKFGIHFSDGDKGGKGSFFIDDVLIEQD